MNEQKTICFPHKPGSGGPGSFQKKFSAELEHRGWKVMYRGDTGRPDLVFVVGGTRHILWLIWMKIKGIPLLYRLDGINWLHRKKQISYKHWIKAEITNLINKCIHAYIADYIVYQSAFVQRWWNHAGFVVRKNVAVIYNGVVMPDSVSVQQHSFQNRLLILEGNIDYTPYAIRLLNELADKLRNKLEIVLYGNFEMAGSQMKLSRDIHYGGFLPRESVNDVMYGSIYLSLDIQPACPNTVIEALSCGVPVVAFDTGSLNELVTPEAGMIVPYGSDPWQLAYPDVESLVKAILKVRDSYATYSQNARKLAVERFSVAVMTDKYLGVIDV